MRTKTPSLSLSVTTPPSHPTQQCTAAAPVCGKSGFISRQETSDIFLIFVAVHTSGHQRLGWVACFRRVCASARLAHVHDGWRQHRTAAGGGKELRVPPASPGGIPRGEMPTWRDEIAKMTPAQVCGEWRDREEPLLFFSRENGEVAPHIMTFSSYDDVHRLWAVVT